MFVALIKTIYEDLDKNVSLAVCASISLHYSLGTYIRNIYLWSSESNVNILAEHYGVSNIDDLSALIINDYLRRQ